MKITSLKISNFKALKKFEISSASDMIILAGPNGCGKTCVLDAIRLLKSAYGGYIPNETQSWLSEFNVTHRPGYIDVAPLLHSADQSLSITAKFTLAPDEVSFLRGDITDLVRDMAVNESPDAPFHRFRTFQSLASQARNNEPAIRSASDRIRREIQSELELGSIDAGLIIRPDGSYQLHQCRLLELIFSTFKPGQVGVIDFQNSNRNYRREPSGSINVSIDQTVDQTSDKARSHSLYNHDQRYSDLKQQLATAYVKALISAKSTGRDAAAAHGNLTDTLKELFATFIPNKTFHGPVPSPAGTLKFDVTTTSGGTHDINDLSAGEKEILYGYLLLRNRTPKNSILMIDEPELHLNPRLVADLPAFYSRHLGSALGNQIWLVTHSDAIVRGAISTAGASVLHLQPAETISETNQATPVLGDTGMRALVLNLVGDLAAFRPAEPIVIFEGGADADDASEFDVHMVTRLFPDFAKRVNSVSGHNRQRVHQIHDALIQARANGLITQQVFSIVDQDDDASATYKPMTGGHIWSRYHIENFLLEARFIREALADLCADRVPFASDEEVEEGLKICAHEAMHKIVSHRVVNSVRSAILNAVKIGCEPTSSNLSAAVSPSIEATRGRLETLWEATLTAGSLDNMIKKTSDDVAAALDNGEWRSKLPGRAILRAFAAKYATLGSGAVGYLTLRNSILGKMVAAGYRPVEMLQTLREVVPALEAN